MRIILGTSSQRRIEIMRTVEPEFDVIVPDIDEAAHRRDNAPALTMATAMAKARAIAGRISDAAIIITADTVVLSAEARIREKPATESEARSWLRSYRTQMANAITSVYALRTPDGLDLIATDSASVAFRTFSEERIAAIIADGTAMSCSGAFTMRHPLFADHIAAVYGDPETIQGLPSRLVRPFLQMLKEA